MTIESDTLRSEIAHLSVEPFDEFRRGNARFWKAFLNDLLE